MSKPQSSIVNPTTVIKVTTDSWKNEVLESSVPVVVDFYATWCGPCQYIAPVLAKLSSELQGTIKFAKLDVDKNAEIVDKHNVQSIPTIIIFKSGKEVASVVGAKSKAELEKLSKTHHRKCRER